MPNMTAQTRAVLAAFIRSDGSEVDLYGLQVVLDDTRTEGDTPG